MNIKDLDGQSHKWNLYGNIAKGRSANKSSYHLKARQMIVSKYPTMQILEEVPIPLKRGETLYLDFYLPLNKTCYEVHGEQHYKFVSHFHSNKLAFLKSQKKDKEKREWCEINGIKYKELPYDKENEWEDIIAND